MKSIYYYYENGMKYICSRINVLNHNILSGNAHSSFQYLDLYTYLCKRVCVCVCTHTGQCEWLCPFFSKKKKLNFIESQLKAANSYLMQKKNVSPYHFKNTKCLKVSVFTITRTANEKSEQMLPVKTENFIPKEYLLSTMPVAVK